MASQIVNCPRCRNQVPAEIQQLFDVNSDPGAKQKMLSGNINVIHCPHCGYEGPISTPVVYHDAEKELLLTFFPPDLGVPVNDQERQIGPIIKRVVDNLPNEKRKGYLFRPQTMFTMQGLVEKVLEGEGISKEMIQAQQERLKLIQRLIDTDPNNRLEIIKQNEEIIDQDLFAILSRIYESTSAQGDQNTGQRLAELQQQLLKETEKGREIQTQIKETEEALKSLQEAGKDGLTREKLLDLFINAPSETRLRTLVSYAHSAMDYTFYQTLTDRIEKSEGEEKKKLTELREKLLQLSQEIEKQVQIQVSQARQVLDKITSSDNIKMEIQNNIESINELFVEIIKTELQAAKENNDQDRLNKLEEIVSVLQEMSPPPQELVLIEELLATENEDQLQKAIEKNTDKLTPEFLQVINNLIAQSENQKQPAEMQEKLKSINKKVLRHSMKMNLQS